MYFKYGKPGTKVTLVTKTKAKLLLAVEIKAAMLLKLTLQLCARFFVNTACWLLAFFSILYQ